MTFRFRICSAFVLCLLLSACESPGPKPKPASDTDGLRDIIPTAEKDSGPSQPIDMSHIPDAVPRYETRTAAGNKSPYKVKGIVYRIMDNPSGYKEDGIASWYGNKFHGNTTSNGEIYDMYGMTGAHKTLPIPSYVRVTNLDNKKSIVVRINDRGPFAHGRIIDLSYAGAQKLGYAHAGTARVRVEYIDVAPNTPAQVEEATTTTVPTTPSAAPQRYLQIGAFSEESAALTAQFQTAALTQWPVNVEPGKTVDQKVIYRVYLGPLPDEDTLLIVKRALMDQGLSEPLRVVK